MGRPTNSDNVIDSRDVIAAIDELESEIESCEDADELADLQDELGKLKALAEEGEHNAGDWRHGATLIADGYFKEYAQQLAEDLGYLKDGNHWPYNCIDWEKAASELQQDYTSYTSLDFDGETYWVRS